MERRVYPRHPLHLDATITVGGFGPRAGKIRDFCAGGMFLTPLEHGAQLPLAIPGSVSTGDAVTIEFSAPTGLHTKPFELHAVVVRTFEGGLGVAFSNPDAAALGALEAFARLASASRFPKDATGSQATVALCQQVLAKRLPGLVQAFFETINERLVLAARGATSNVEQSSYFDAITELQKLRAAIERGFADSVLEGFEHMGAGQGNRGQPGEDACPAELSLLDKDDLEDLLAIGEIVAKAEPRYQELLTEIEQRLAHSARVCLDKASNPVGPAAICHAFRSALRTSNLPIRVMQIIYKVFDDAVLGRFGHVYEELNGVLAANGVPLEPAQPDAGIRSDDMLTSPDGVATDESPSQRLAGGASSSAWGARQQPAAASGPSSPARDAIDGGDTTWEPGALGNPAPAALASRGQRYPGGVAWPTRRQVPESASYPFEARGSGTPKGTYGTGRKLLQLVRGLMGPMSDRPVNPASRLEPAAQSAYTLRADGAGNGDSAGAPTRLQHVAHPELLQAPFAASSASHVATLRAGGEDVLHAEVSEACLEDVAFLDQVLGSIEEDPFVCEDAKNWIQRLAIPLGKTAVRDKEFWSCESHPASQVLDQIAQLRPALLTQDGQQEHEVVAEVNRIIEQIEREQAPDARIFAGAQAQLAALLAKQNERYATNVCQVVQAREEQQAFVKARQTAGKEAIPAPRTRARAIPDEWQAWLSRAKRLNVGDVVTLDAGSRNPRRGTLAWIGEDHNPCVFVDELGNKLATLSLQELAMQLHRGTLNVAVGAPVPIVDRAVYASLRKLHGRIEYHATHDSTTGLLNPKTFRRHLAHALDQGGDGKHPPVLCWLRLPVPGSLAGDEAAFAQQALLRGLADVLRKRLGNRAVLARAGEDVLGALTEVRDENGGGSIAEELRRLVEQYRITWRGQDLVAHGDVSVVPIVEGYRRVAGWLAHAASGAYPDAAVLDESTHEAQSRQPVCRQHAMPEAVDIDRALTPGRLRFMCQRIAPTHNGEGENPYYQIVLGLQREDGSALPLSEVPQTPYLRRYLPALDRQVIAQVFRWLWAHRSVWRHISGVAINLSAQSVSDESLTEFLVQQFTESKVPPGKVCFEIAEQSMVASLTSASSLIRTIGEFGCRFALDDFGGAEASYSCLKELPFCYIKIDGSFVKDILASPSDFAVVKSINEIGHFLGKKTVAKTVETEEVLRHLCDIGVDYAQGPWIEDANPVDEAIIALLNEPIAFPIPEDCAVPA